MCCFEANYSVGFSATIIEWNLVQSFVAMGCRFHHLKVAATGPQKLNSIQQKNFNRVQDENWRQLTLSISRNYLISRIFAISAQQ